MIKPGDSCKRKHPETGEWIEESYFVFAVKDNKAVICLNKYKNGEFCWKEEVNIADLAPGENTWRPIAEWVWNQGRGPGESFYYCSNCVEGGSEFGEDNFCSCCGARMRRE